jgi:hypothetical protein
MRAASSLPAVRGFATQIFRSIHLNFDGNFCRRFVAINILFATKMAVAKDIHGRSQNYSRKTKNNILRRAGVSLILALATSPTISSAQSAIPSTQDIAFGRVPSIYSDLVSVQSICSFGNLLPVRYSVMATGSGSGGAFTVTNGTTNIPYEVQWAQVANATSGENLSPLTPLFNQTSGGDLLGLGCLLGVRNATLIVIVRSSALQIATAGSYLGTLNLLVTAQ